MVTAVANIFTTYQFEGDEGKVAATFNHLQKMFLANMRYDCMMQRDNLVVNFEHPEDYFYAKAQLDGQIATLTILIDLEVEDVTQTQAQITGE